MLGKLDIHMQNNQTWSLPYTTNTSLFEMEISDICVSVPLCPRAHAHPPNSSKSCLHSNSLPFKTLSLRYPLFLLHIQSSKPLYWIVFLGIQTFPGISCDLTVFNISDPFSFFLIIVLFKNNFIFAVLTSSPAIHF